MPATKWNFPLQRIPYAHLKSSKAKENYNYQKISGVLAEYGFTTLRLSDDWKGADFIAQHVSGMFLKVQLKSRLGFAKKYIKGDIYICFRHHNDVYLFPHDELLAASKKILKHHRTKSWIENGAYNWPKIPKELFELLGKYRLTSEA